ncbi:hypothetical protein KFK09_018582 [Dendrobium nobile]|uniref:Uncharacterized protein n=1 Tax=Dendrobium nobile TaxID=94219 RepID=A0A8T3AW54_DENNO|nr:hypothetical protein KFK09_018582 [Dendrobium nobile]
MDIYISEEYIMARRRERNEARNQVRMVPRSLVGVKNGSPAAMELEEKRRRRAPPAKGGCFDGNGYRDEVFLNCF